ncbi:hypothetical protein V6Z11_D13G186100 [Gossypium hirsutum]
MRNKNRIETLWVADQGFLLLLLFLWWVYWIFLNGERGEDNYKKKDRNRPRWNRVMIDVSEGEKQVGRKFIFYRLYSMQSTT